MNPAMRRAAPALPISPKMFRHFAVITVAVTACVGLFADGEGQEALAKQIEARQAKNQTLAIEAEKVGKRTLRAHNLKLRDEGRAYLAFAQEPPEPEGNFGAPMDRAGQVVSNAPNLAAMRSSEPMRQPRTGLPPGLKSAPMTLGKDGKPLAAKRGGMRGPTPPTEQEIAGLVSASQSRSGTLSAE